MGSALPIGEPAPRDGALPVAIDDAAQFGVYLHVPFCLVRCGYCDFNTYTAGELRGARQDEYADTLLREVELARNVLTDAGGIRPASTVFFGGGTPTLLPPGDLARMLGGVRQAFGIAPGAEVTVEANPDTVTDAVVDELAAAGVTRMSIGMQSAVPHVLAALDRTHEPANVGTAVASARRAGLDVSVDLIYGAPGESLEDWRASLETAAALDPDHISAYALIVEDGTKLARQIRRGEVPAPDDDLQADMYELADDLLAQRRLRLVRGVQLVPRPDAPIPSQSRLLAGIGLVGLRAGGAQPHRGSALLEREAPGGLCAEAGGGRVACRGTRAAGCRSPDARERAAAHPHPRGPADLGAPR